VRSDPAIVARYRAALARSGGPVTFRRLVGDAPNTVPFVATDIVAKVYAFSTAEILGGAPVGSHYVIVLEEDLAAKSFPVPLLEGDTIETDDKRLTVKTVDAETRALAGAYEIVAIG
jgi:hypothetical protein